MKHLMRSTPSHGVESFQKWGQGEVALNEALRSCASAVHAAFCDNIDTRTALEAIRDLVSQGNAYMESCRSAGQPFNRGLLKDVAAYITRIFDTLGLISRPEEVGFPASSKQAANVGNCVIMVFSRKNSSNFLFLNPKD